mgnify:CR=1 FL=1
MFSNKIKVFLLISICLIFFLITSFDVKSNKVKVVDGDTIHLNGEKIRFSGIDTPEIKQLCNKNDEVIKELIEERASGFKDPDQYKQWIFSNEEQLKNIESIALEEQVTELISSEAKCEIEQLSFEEMMSMG